MIILTGSSASGKTEVAKIIKLKYKIKKVITHTTRAKRLGEVDGIDYHYVTKEDFLLLKEAGEFVETTIYNNNYYGTSKKEINGDKILIVDPNGLQSFLNLKDESIITFKLIATETTRFNRMIMRGDELDQVKSRLKNDIVSFSDDKTCGIHYTISTEDKTIEEVADIINSIYCEFKKCPRPQQ